MQTQCYIIMARGTTQHETLTVESLVGLPIQNFNCQFYFNGFAVCKAANLFFSAEMFSDNKLPKFCAIIWNTGSINLLIITILFLQEYHGSVNEVVYCCIRRSLCYPLYRHWDLVQVILQDTRQLFHLGIHHFMHMHMLTHYTVTPVNQTFKKIRTPG